MLGKQRKAMITKRKPKTHLLKLKQDIQAFKKVAVIDTRNKASVQIGHAVIEMLIPKGALVVRSFFVYGEDEKGRPTSWDLSRKMRTNKAKVVRLLGWRRSEWWDSGIRRTPLPFYIKLMPIRCQHRDGMTYQIGQDVTPSCKFDRSNEQCSTGIHFYRTSREAWAH